jgi:hypothetical protein
MGDTRVLRAVASCRLLDENVADVRKKYQISGLKYLETLTNSRYIVLTGYQPK